MNVKEVKEKIMGYCRNPLRMSEEDQFVLNELCRFIYEETGDTSYLIEGSNETVADPRHLEKIYLLSINNGQEHNCYLLAKLYASGKLGSFDFKKAYEYYLRAAKTQKIGDGTSIDESVTDYHNLAKLELAKMYRNGLYVKKDYDRYRKIVNEIYEEIKDQSWQDYRFEELFEKAKLDLEEGNIEEGLEILFKARRECWILLKYMQDEASYRLLKEMNDLLYKYIDLDLSDIGPEDLTELLKQPITVRFLYDDIFYKIRSYQDGEDVVIEFEDNLYRDPIDFIMKAKAGDTWLREMLFNSDMWEVKR